jgi:hypothetical protein
VVGGIFNYRLPAQFSALDLVVPWHKVDHLGAELARQFGDKLVLLVRLPAVADKPAEPHAAALGVFQDTAGYVVRSVHRHHLAGGHNVYLLGLAFTYGHGETAADHITKDIIKNKFRVLSVCAVLFEKIDRRNHPAARAAHARLRTA